MSRGDLGFHDVDSEVAIAVLPMFHQTRADAVTPVAGANGGGHGSAEPNVTEILKKHDESLGLRLGKWWAA